MESKSSFCTYCRYPSGSPLCIHRACIFFLIFFFYQWILFIPLFTRSNHSFEISFLSVFSSAISVSVSIRHGLWKSLRSQLVCSLWCHFLSSSRPRSEGLCCVIIDSRHSWQTLGCLYTESSASGQTARSTRVHTLKKRSSRFVPRLLT